MKFQPHLPTTLLLALVAAPAGAQEPTPVDLARVRATFGSADRDSDGFIGIREAVRAGIPSKDFAGQDADRDRQLSGAEFVVYYHYLLMKAGRPVAADLDSEAARIQAQRRTQEEARKKEAETKESQEPAGEPPASGDGNETVRSEDPAPPGPAPAPASGREGARGGDTPPAGDTARRPSTRPQRPAGGGASDSPSSDPAGDGLGVRRLSTAERLRRARAALQQRDGGVAPEPDSSDAERAAAMRLKQRSAEMRENLARDQARRDEARADGGPAVAVGVDDAAATGAGDQPTQGVDPAELERRAEAMRLKTRSKQMRDELATQGAAAGDDESPATRAERWVKRFVDAGLIEAPEARTLAAALAEGRIAALTPKERQGVLGSLARARTRLDRKRESGALPQDQAQELARLLTTQESRVREDVARPSNPPADNPAKASPDAAADKASVEDAAAERRSKPAAEGAESPKAGEKPGRGEGAEKPQRGGDEAKPKKGGDEAKPQRGGDQAKPKKGGDEAKPKKGGDEAKPKRRGRG